MDSEREPSDEEIEAAYAIVRQVATHLLVENVVYEREYQRWQRDTYEQSLVAVADSGLDIPDEIVKHMAGAVVHDLNRLPHRFPNRG